MSITANVAITVVMDIAAMITIFTTAIMTNEYKITKLIYKYAISRIRVIRSQGFQVGSPPPMLKFFLRASRPISYLYVVLFTDSTYFANF